MLSLLRSGGGCATGTGESRTVQLAERPTWEPNDAWTYAGRRAGGPYTITRKVLREGLFEGYPAYEVEAGPAHYWFTKRLGYLARLNGDKVVRRAIPPEDFQWPLQVGKQWSSTLTWTDGGEPERRARHARRRPLRRPTAPGVWGVGGYEDVKTPAGTFKAFKISRREVQSGAWQEFWYSPVVKSWVKIRAGGGPDGDFEEELSAYSTH